MKKPKAKKFDTTPCGTCRHPKGIHHPVCWAYGLVEPRCRQHCQKFTKDKKETR